MTEFIQAIRQDWIVTLPFIVLFVSTTAMDIIAGLVVAFNEKKLCSKISRAGMMRKAIKLGTVMLAAVFDGVLPPIRMSLMGVELTLTFAAIGCVWWLIHELLSIIEHCSKLGLPLPGRLRDALLIVKESLDADDAAKALPGSESTEKDRL